MCCTACLPASGGRRTCAKSVSDEVDGSEDALRTRVHLNAIPSRHFAAAEGVQRRPTPRARRTPQDPAAARETRTEALKALPVLHPPPAGCDHDHLIVLLPLILLKFS
ncbi:hypothetical protein C8J57DRAFT_1527164 [Mycena rebaudengoi]|nr:hypothetical protein C8J57DRAFT_1527164 [Mycena rebaudengoi]